MPTPASFARDAYGDTLVVTTDIAGDKPRAIPLHQSAFGAVLRVDAASLSLGAVPLTTTSSGSLVVRNVGNGPTIPLLLADIVCRCRER